MPADVTPNIKPAAYRPKIWRTQYVPMSNGKFYREVADGHIELVKMGTATLVLTQPEDYVAALKERFPQRPMRSRRFGSLPVEQEAA